MSDTPSDEPVAKRKRVRKGTHSCCECRRRKVKCTFSSPDDAVCITCHRRGTKCISQELTGEPETAEGDLTEDDGNAERDAATHTGLLPTPESNHGTNPVASPYPSITRALLNSLPPRQDIEILLGSLSSMSVVCHLSSFKIYNSWPGEIARKQIPEANLLYPESHPVLLARQMLRFAVGLQYLSPAMTIPGLTKHHRTIMEQLADSAIKHVNANDVLLGTLEGLENLILEGYYHIDVGNIRRSWITLRRAVMAAQLLGVYRPGHYRFKILDRQNHLNPTVMWACVVTTEQFLSLLLGLPTSTSGATFTIPRATSARVEGGALPVLIPGVVRKIIERNQMQKSQKKLDMTQEIDQELLRVTEQWTPAFWRPIHLAGLPVDSEEAFGEIRRAWDHMYYYTLVNQLHLPYMLNPEHISQRTYSRIACANASREVLTRQILIRTFSPLTAGCRMGDFLALVAGMTLMLAHILSHCNKGTENLLVHQRVADRATVERALECMESTLALPQDVLAAKCACLLKNLLYIESGRADQGLQGGLEGGQGVMMVKVPYVGTIRIARDGVSVAPWDPEQEQMPNEYVTLGGLGSIHVKAQHDPEYGNTAATSDGQVSHAVSAGVLVLPEDVPPDASASMEEWLFQGFDTAFFDVLMRGAGALPLNGSDCEGWNFASPS